MVDLNNVRTSKIKVSEYLIDDFDDFGIWKHGVIGSGDIEVALVELPKPSFGHFGLIASVDFGDMVPFD